MAKGMSALLDAADSDATEYTVVDWIVWILLQATSLSSAWALWLLRQQGPGSGKGENVVAQLARGLERLLLEGTLLELAAVLGFFFCAACLLLLQAGQRYVWRLLIGSVVVGVAYSWRLGDWLHNVPIFIWTSLLMSSVAQLVVDFGKPASEKKSVARLL